jgi:hypothetical protein
MSKPKKKLKKLKRVLPAERILNALAGLLAMGYPFIKDRCVSCQAKKSDQHHKGCVFRESVKLVLKYYKP